MPTPQPSGGTALLGFDLSALPHPSFAAAHRVVLYDIAADALDAFDADHQTDAALLAEQFAAARLAGTDHHGPDQQPSVYGPTHRGTHYSIRRVDTAAPAEGSPTTRHPRPAD